MTKQEYPEQHKPIWIELVNTGVANRFDFKDNEIIEMNWRLTKYPRLYQKVYQHEIAHDSGNYKFFDFMLDMKEKTPGLFKFMAKHISAWTQVLPFYWDRKRKQFVYDISTIVSWMIIFNIAIFTFYILEWLLWT